MPKSAGTEPLSRDRRIDQSSDGDRCDRVRGELQLSSVVFSGAEHFWETTAHSTRPLCVTSDVLVRSEEKLFVLDAAWLKSV